MRARERGTGRYAPEDMDALCECGHPLGEHTAVRARVDGRVGQPCITHDFTANAPCHCDCFTKKAGRGRRGVSR